MPNKEPTAAGNDIKFEALFNSATMAIIVVDKQGVIVMANEYANSLFAYMNDSMV
jgi:PAS domain S-box-containing protein